MDSNPNASLPSFNGWVKSGELLTVTIGRNVGDEPMSLAAWRDFQDTLVLHVTNVLKPSLQFGPFFGEGSWQGVTEQSVVFTFVVGYTTSVDDVNSVLTGLAIRFGQDAIAYASGTARLAEVPAQLRN